MTSRMNHDPFHAVGKDVEVVSREAGTKALDVVPEKPSRGKAHRKTAASLLL